MSRYITIDWYEVRTAWARFKRRLTPKVLREAHDCVVKTDRFIVTQQKRRHMDELAAYAEFKPGSLTFSENMDLFAHHALQDMRRDLERQIWGSNPIHEFTGLKVIVDDMVPKGSAFLINPTEVVFDAPE
jgi:hypothetical protein